MSKKVLILAVSLALTLGLVSYFAIGCGSSAGGGASTATTTTTVAGGTSAQTIAIKGVASGTSSSVLGCIRAMAALTDADVQIVKPFAGSATYEVLATGKTDSTGAYTINVPIALISADAVSNNVSNLMVIITKGGVTVGATLANLNITSSDAFCPYADESGYAKQRLALGVFGKGEDPRNFDYNSRIEQKYTNMDYDATKFDAMADAIYDAEQMRGSIATGLGISTTILEQLDRKAMQYHQTYIDPIFQAAFNSKTEPDRLVLDAAFANMEQAMQTYAISLGLTTDQFNELKNMHNKQEQSKMQAGLGANDPIFKEGRRRDSGRKIEAFFLSQWAAANTLANASTSGRVSFASANPNAYTAFVASKDAIAEQIRIKTNDSAYNDNQGFMGEMVSRMFMDAWVFPPMENQPEGARRGSEEPTFDGDGDWQGGEGGGGPPPVDEAEMRAMMQQYVNTRIMIYFMNFFTEQQMQSIFQGMNQAMQPVFVARETDTTCAYYMGHDFWATDPAGSVIEARMTAFKTALDNAVNSAVGTSFTTVFGSSATAYKNAFKVLSAPPDVI